MNKFKFFVGLVIMGIIALSIPVSTILVTSVGLTSCDTGYGNDYPIDTDTIILPLVPYLNIYPPQSTVFDVSWGEVIDFEIEAKSNAKSNKDLKQIKFEIKFSTGLQWDTSWYPKATENKIFTIKYDYRVPLYSNIGDLIRITVSAIDVDSMIHQHNFLLTVKDLSGLKVYNDVILGAQANATYGSFYSTSTNTVYKVADALTQGQSKVDFIYFYGYQKRASIAAPTYSVFNNSSGELASYNVYKWTTKRTTKFKQLITLTEGQWKSLTDAIIQQKYATASTAEEDISSHLVDTTGGYKPSYYCFKTSSSKYGIFRVKSISAYDTTGYIIIDVKVMK